MEKWRTEIWRAWYRSIAIASLLSALAGSTAAQPLISIDSFDRHFRLLPKPQRISMLQGEGIAFPGICRICLKGTGRLPVMPPMLKHLPISNMAGKGSLTLALQTDLQLPDEGYKLCIGDCEASICARGEAGLFYGLQTLGQLLEDAHDQSFNIPACEIVDYPAIACRAVHIDLKSHLDAGWYYYDIIDRLAGIKVNTLIIEFEDKLRYRKAPLIGAPNAISIEEFAAITRYAQARNIGISPLVQGLGHASFILKHPEYRGLRDDSLSDYVFDPLDPETYALQFSMYEDAIAATPEGKYIHIGGDEVTALGRSARAKASGMSPLQLQLYWLKKVTAFAAAHNRIPIFWDDMLFKVAGLYGTTYDSSMDKEKVRELWKKDHKTLDENAGQFPADCIYARWNYESPSALGNRMALDWYKRHRLEVMPATAAQQSSLMLPRNHSNFSGIRDFCQLSAARKIDKILCTDWDDSSPHFETYWRGLYDFAAFSWNAADQSEQTVHAIFRHRFYSPALASDTSDFQDLLEEEAVFWETAFLRDGDRENYHLVFDLLTLPDPHRTGQWSRQYSAKIREAREALSKYSAIRSRISHALTTTRRNRYALQVMDQINEIMGYSASMLLLLDNYDNAAPSDRRQEAISIQNWAARFPVLRADFEKVYAVSRISGRGPGYVLDSNPRAHWANATVNTDWNYYIELQMNKKISEWLKEIGYGK